MLAVVVGIAFAVVLVANDHPFLGFIVALMVLEQGYHSRKNEGEDEDQDEDEDE